MSRRNDVKHHGKRSLYAAVPMELARDGKLSHPARSVALYVWSHDVKFHQSAKDVADKLGISRNTVTKALAELQDRGWLVRERLSQTSERWHLQMSNAPFTPDEIREHAQEMSKLNGCTTCSPDEQVDSYLLTSCASTCS